MQYIEIPLSENRTRLDRCIRRLLGNINQAVLEKFLRSGLILLDKKKVKSSIKVETGQKIYFSSEINFEKKQNKKLWDFHTYEFYKNLFNKICIKNTKHYIALNKPNGLAVQGGTSQKYHIDEMFKYLFEDHNIPKLVHRIDKDTSGLLLLATNQSSAKQLTSNFREKQIIKTYLALVSPCPKSNMDILNLPLHKSGFREKQKIEVNFLKGKNAVTQYKVIDKNSDNFALLALYPKTGRTHQIRVHLNYINSPIVGDKKYNGLNRSKFYENKTFRHKKIINSSNETLLTKNLQLHAYSIRMPSNEVIEAEISKDFKKNLKILGLSLPENVSKIFVK